MNTCVNSVRRFSAGPPKKKTAIPTLLLMMFLLVIPLAADEKIVVSVTNDATWKSDSLYIVNSDGTNRVKLFDFTTHPKHPEGRILDLYLDPSGQNIFFSSDNSFMYTPAGKNIFRLFNGGKNLEQMTPGPNSNKWNQPCPCGSVQGIIKTNNGFPIVGSQVYLEGVGTTQSKQDGSFVFEKVPIGERWVMAYQQGRQEFASAFITVKNSSVTNTALIFADHKRVNYQFPKTYQKRLYYLAGTNSVHFTTDSGKTFTNVYTSKGDCPSSDVDGYDIAPRTGKLLFMDYQSGCNTNRGLYISDENGGKLQLAIDMKLDPGWCGGKDVFWSPDESKVAFTACYRGKTCIYVYSTSTAQPLGFICAPDSRYTLNNTKLYGWNPGGNRLLYSMHTNNPAQNTLSTVTVMPDGKLDINSIRNILTNVPLSGASWIVTK